MPLLRRLPLARLAAVLVCAAGLTGFSLFGDEDEFQWLEETGAERVRTWVAAENEKTLSALVNDPVYDDLLAAAEEVVLTEDRIPFGTLEGGYVWNHWQAPDHPRGLWRRARLSEYRKARPAWETLLDLDALGRAEGAAWTFEGADCLPPAFRRCLIELALDGTDTAVVREFDVAAKGFVPDGFAAPPARSDASWESADAILLATDWGPGSLTRSGYPRIVKRLRRGAAPEQAETVFEGELADVAVETETFVTPQGRQSFVYRWTGVSGVQIFHLGADGPKQLPVPAHALLAGVHEGQAVFTLREDWPVEGATLPAGAVVAFDLAAWETSGALPPVSALFLPGPRQAVRSAMPGRTGVFVAYLDEVQGRLAELRYAKGAWLRREIETPRTGSLELESVSPFDPEVLYTLESYLTPARLMLLAPGARPRELKALPARFDAAHLEELTLTAAAPDGTAIPYTLVRPKGAANDGSLPTILYGYGGFQQAETPFYWTTPGRLWLARGRALAVANIRGGGEFGPRWWEAALRENRPVAFADFVAVGRDLVARGVTSNRRLGLWGGSNGGLLVGAAMAAAPDLAHAVLAEAPLLDMRRYVELGAGASWIEEYGDPRDEAMWERMRTWSPYHALERGVPYPRMFLMTAASDGHVTPAHARKMAARLERLGRPYHFYEETGGERGGAAELQLLARHRALQFTFFERELAR